MSRSLQVNMSTSLRVDCMLADSTKNVANVQKHQCFSDNLDVHVVSMSHCRCLFTYASQAGSTALIQSCSCLEHPAITNHGHPPTSVVCIHVAININFMSVLKNCAPRKVSCAVTVHPDRGFHCCKLSGRHSGQSTAAQPVTPLSSHCCSFRQDLGHPLLNNPSRLSPPATAQYVKNHSADL